MSDDMKDPTPPEGIHVEEDKGCGGKLLYLSGDSSEMYVDGVELSDFLRKVKKGEFDGYIAD